MKTEKEIAEFKTKVLNQLATAQGIEEIKYLQGMLASFEWLSLEDTQEEKEE